MTDPVTDADGVLTASGFDAAQEYAQAWQRGERLNSLEGSHPTLIDLFYDIRNDAALAREHATP